MTHVEAVKSAKHGYFTAVFTRGVDAKAFYDRLNANPDADYVYSGTIRINRKGGRIVTWSAAPKAFENHGRDDGPGIFQYWADMAEVVGYYGSTFGEPPFGTGRRTATLNGRPCPASV